MTTVRGANAGDLVRIRELLSSNDLPTADLEHAPIDFVVAADGDGLAGVVGMESYGDVGLLRSLAVRTGLRGRGHGRALVAAVEVHARASGKRQLVLLTQTAASLFARLGYETIVRDAAPAAVRRSAEFTSLCPASAICMAKDLPTLP